MGEFKHALYAQAVLLFVVMLFSFLLGLALGPYFTADRYTQARSVAPPYIVQQQQHVFQEVSSATTDEEQQQLWRNAALLRSLGNTTVESLLRGVMLLQRLSNATTSVDALLSSGSSSLPTPMALESMLASSAGGSAAAPATNCSCLVADADSLHKACTFQKQGWPANNEQQIVQCMDFLAHNHSQYLSTRSGPANCSKPLVLHTFWAGDISWKLKLVIDAFLFTHYAADAACAPKPKLFVWLQTKEDARLQLADWAKQWNAPYLLCSDQLEFKQWPDAGWLDWVPADVMASILAKHPGSSLAPLRDAVRATARDKNFRVVYSDAVRFLVTYKYGGIYFDADILLLRSMQPFSALNFVYEWGSLPNKTNTAIVGLQQGNTLGLTLIKTALDKAIKVNGTSGNVTFDMWAFKSVFHPLHIFDGMPAEVQSSVHVLPSALFDPLWVTVDSLGVGKYPSNNVTQLHLFRSFKEAFGKPPAHLQLPTRMTDIFQGAFAYHWHNNWNAPFVNESVMGQLSGEYSAFVQGQRPNQAGLTFKACRRV